MYPSRHDWKIVDWDVKPQHKQTNVQMYTIDGVNVVAQLYLPSLWAFTFV